MCLQWLLEELSFPASLPPPSGVRSSKVTRGRMRSYFQMKWSLAMPLIPVKLYGNLHSSAFAAGYECLRDARVPFVVRYLGVVAYEEDPSAPSSKDIVFS